MKILVFGASGFLGRSIVECLNDSNYLLVPSTRDGRDATLACDLSSPKYLINLLDEVNPECIINCAVNASFDSNVLSSQYCINTLVPGLIANWCAKRPAHFIHISGTLVYGVKSTRINLDSIIKPDTDYSISKYLAEQLIQASGCLATIIRFGGIYGDSGPDHLGFNRVIKNAKKGIVPALHGQGKAKRNYIYVSDAAKVVRHCLLNKRKGVVLSAGSEILSIKEMFNIVCDVFLQGVSPNILDAKEALEQIVISSEGLPQTSSLKNVLQSMK